ncbi:hypothetical protein RTBOTA2_004630, partial [Rhodotorula toruloides]
QAQQENGNDATLRELLHDGNDIVQQSTVNDPCEARGAMDRPLSSASASHASSPAIISVPPLAQAANTTFSSSSSPSQSNANAAPANSASSEAASFSSLEKERVIWAEEHVPQHTAKAGGGDGEGGKGGKAGEGGGAKMGPLGS